MCALVYFRRTAFHLRAFLAPLPVSLETRYPANHEGKHKQNPTSTEPLSHHVELQETHTHQTLYTSFNHSHQPDGTYFISYNKTVNTFFFETLFSVQSYPEPAKHTNCGVSGTRGDNHHAIWTTKQHTHWFSSAYRTPRLTCVPDCTMLPVLERGYQDMDAGSINCKASIT